MENQNVNVTKKSQILIENRKDGKITGVEKVLSVNPSGIALMTVLGELNISGKSLKIVNFTESDGIFQFEGSVDGINFAKQKEPLLKRIFK